MWALIKVLAACVLAAICQTAPAGAQLVSKKVEKASERRIIVRYSTSDASTSLVDRVKNLETIPGVRRAKALPRLDMAVITCDSEEGEETLLDILDTHDDVELAVPDTWVSADDFKHVEADSAGSSQSACEAHPSCKGMGLNGSCCPSEDGIRLACCEEPAEPEDSTGPKLRPHPHGYTTVSLQSYHGGFVRAYPAGFVGFHDDKEHPHARFFIVPHADGHVSFKTMNGLYLVADPVGRIMAWPRRRHRANDWEKFKLTYNQDGTISLRGKSSDLYVGAENPSWGVLSCNRDVADESGKFTVHVKHGPDAVIPSDTNFSKLWGMDHFGGRDIDAVEAWKIFTGDDSKGIIVAVIDTGIDYTHPDLKDQMWVNPNEIPGNGIDDDGNGIIDDVHGADFANSDGDPFDDQMHGTHCSGTIAGRGDNGEGVAGVSWKGVKLMALKFLSKDGGGRTSDAVSALDYAVAMGARITSNSWGGGGSSSAMRVAIERATQAGMLFIAAAGNEATDNDQVPHFPSNYASGSIVSVAATTYKGELSSFSCYGQTTVDVAAPGSDIFSTVPGAGYDSLSGTSMACPHVSGLAALVWMYRPHLSMMQVKEILMQSSVREEALQGSSISNGRINARRALELAAQYEAPIPPVHAAQGLVFTDVDPRVGMVGGVATITAASNEDDVDYYSLHFISSAGYLMDSLGQAPATGKATLTIELNGSVAIPGFVTGLAVVTGNASAEAGHETAVIADLEDYGVPEHGPQAVYWAGDYDGRPKWVAGALQIQRAPNEASVSHYNVYWKDGGVRGNLVDSIPAVGFKTPTCSGCELINQSYADGIYSYHRGPYENNEYAEISFSGPATVTITEFNTEKYYDYLEVAGTQITGTDVALPKIIEVPAGPAAISWYSDTSEVAAGWTIQMQQSGQNAELVLDPVKPTTLEVEVAAAYGKWESNETATGTILDFDSETMTPSAAFTPKAIRFKDTNVAAGFIEGLVEIQPADIANNGVVTAYDLVLADDEGNKVGHLTWSVDYPVNSSVAAAVPIPNLKLPLTASKFVARAVSSTGESEFETTLELVDIVRSPPQGAAWSGDSDGDMGIVKGTLTITPAAVTINVVGYSIYTATVTQKSSFLTRVAATSDGTPITAEIHYYYTQGEGLLVVTAYADGEMDSGVFVEVDDMIEVYEEPDDNETEPDADYGWGGWGWGGWENRRLGSVPQPWLPQMPELSQIHLLWTASEASTASHKVLGSVTIHGMALQVVDPSTGDAVFMPPSEHQRRAILAAVAQSLPGVSAEQVRLLTGRVFTGSAAKARAAGRGRKLSAEVKDASKNSPGLVIDFEVVSMDVSTARQSFLDRVEARLIRMSQGGASAKKLNEAMAKELVKSGYELPESGLHTLVAEPQQVQPRETISETRDRRLKEHEVAGVFTDRDGTVTTVFADDDEDTQESSGTLAAILAVLGATAAVAGAVFIATRDSWKVGRPKRANVEMESISIHVNERSDE
eukprot:CAMPEP_0197660714 /NCGR_PEP_ID=MMETSP1338-20131121/51017_1 /TAXON_ID=43686 ORGANISM="Pelagodinium beii, Strain RCC1491" /NCGR_SAMPLE_ID=MMETSP1338 /ASSEMBLY_ACC=CAM_ASM_000754 /LENGTH=1485 /DNA_ID=CAMNT_0043238131 /DNA_START=61 /DNA_END=4518 /DNA_ORIENTATION=+